MGRRELIPGTLIHGRYRVEQVLGSGGFGVTYRVMDLKENRVSAMKEYMPLDAAYRPMGKKEVRPISESKKGQYERFRQQFLDEAQTIYKFRGHPNIVEVRHLFYENNTAYYVMEYVEGMDLGKFLKSQGGHISWAMLRPIVAQVVSALKQVHSGGMIHCDISPDNIFLMNAGQVKLLDFGAARNTLRGTVEASVIVAKVGYAPYEQMRGRNMGAWTDIYALAVTIYHCVTGRMPPRAEERIVNDNTIWPSQMGVAIPSAQWENALKKAMSVRVEDRYRSVMDFWNALAVNDATRPVFLSDPQPVNPSFDLYQPKESTTPNVLSPQHPGHGIPVLECVKGSYAGRKMPIQQELYLGVDASKCSIVYPKGTPGISRVHLRIWPDNGRLMVMDMGSTYGTWLAGKKMIPGLAYSLAPGSYVYLGGGQMFRAAESG